MRKMLKCKKKGKKPWGALQYLKNEIYMVVPCSKSPKNSFHKYLVIVDRFSNWPTVHQVKAGAGAEVQSWFFMA